MLGLRQVGVGVGVHVHRMGRAEGGRRGCLCGQWRRRRVVVHGRLRLARGRIPSTMGYGQSGWGVLEMGFDARADMIYKSRQKLPLGRRKTSGYIQFALSRLWDSWAWPAKGFSLGTLDDLVAHSNHGVAHSGQPGATLRPPQRHTQDGIRGILAQRPRSPSARSQRPRKSCCSRRRHAVPLLQLQCHRPRSAALPCTALLVLLLCAVVPLAERPPPRPCT